MIAVNGVAILQQSPTVRERALPRLVGFFGKKSVLQRLGNIGALLTDRIAGILLRHERTMLFFPVPTSPLTLKTWKHEVLLLLLIYAQTLTYSSVSCDCLPVIWRYVLSILMCKCIDNTLRVIR